MPSHVADRYRFSVGWSNEDRAFVARVAEFPALSADGSTQRKALQEMQSILKSVLRDLKKSGQSIPTPFGERRFSGRLNLRMPASLHRQLAIEAAQQGVSLNQIIIVKLSEHLR